MQYYNIGLSRKQFTDQTMEMKTKPFGLIGSPTVVKHQGIYPEYGGGL